MGSHVERERYASCALPCILLNEMWRMHFCRCSEAARKPSSAPVGLPEGSFWIQDRCAILLCEIINTCVAGWFLRRMDRRGASAGRTVLIGGLRISPKSDRLEKGYGEFLLTLSGIGIILAHSIHSTSMLFLDLGLSSVQLQAMRKKSAQKNGAKAHV